MSTDQWADENGNPMFDRTADSERTRRVEDSNAQEAPTPEARIAKALPTWDEIEAHALRHLDEARNEMSEVRDWLRSDWRPVGSPLTDADAAARGEVLRIASEVKRLIDQAKDILHG